MNLAIRSECLMLILLLALFGSLSACAALPSRVSLPELHSAGHFASQASFEAPSGEWPAEGWWKGYGDAQLDRLIGEALAGSPTIAIADARLKRAEAASRVARSALAPQIAANASASEQKQSYNYLSPSAVTPQNWNDYGRASLDFSWELDFWGRNRAALAAATSEREATRADAAQAKLSLSTAIASNYAELARQYAALDTAKSSFEVRSRTADLFRHRYDSGLETLGSVRQVEARRAASDGDVQAIEEQIALLKNRVALLVGAGPDRALSIERPVIQLDRSFALPSQLSADLLGHRPDVTAARLRAEAAAARIHQARAAFYPNINLAAYVGFQSLDLNLLTDSGSSIGSVGPALSLPIFTGGKLRGQLRGAEAEYAEAAANYDRAVLQALEDVADAAISQKSLGRQIARANEAVEAARAAWRIQNNRYQGGLASYLDVLAAEDYLLSNLRVESDLKARAFALDVALVRALGGGYAPKAS